MTRVSEVMTSGCECIGEHESITTAAIKMKALEVGALPICGDDNRLKGMLTDRDIVLEVLAARLDPDKTEAGRLASGVPVYIQADRSVDEALALMSEHQIRRLPVLDPQKQLVGIVSQGDLAVSLDHARTDSLVEDVSA